MASAVAEQFIRSRHKIEVWDHDPGTTDATVTTPDGGTTQRWVDMRDHERLAAICITTVKGGNGPVKLEIVAAEDTAGTNVQVIKDSGTVAPDALCDWVIQECSADEIAQAGAAGGYALRYAAARITTHHSGDEAVIVYLTCANRKYLDQTPATTIS